jgi:3-deoxy-D-manno-octulosonic-acid transferase
MGKGLNWSLSAPSSALVRPRLKRNFRRFICYLLYWLLQWLAAPLVLLHFLVRILQSRAYANHFPERLGQLPQHIRQHGNNSIWIHAVSLGEVLASAGLIQQIRERFPVSPVYLSVTAVAGRTAALKHVEGLVDGVFYAPVDYRFAVRSVLRRIRPALLVVLETEVWPNLYREIKRSGAGLLMANARISDKAFPRYKRFRWFFREVLSLPDRILCQDAISEERIRGLVHEDSHITVAGNLKFDQPFESTEVPEEIARFVEQTKPEQIFIAASTMPPARSGDIDEEVTAISAFLELSSLFPKMLFLIAPRRPERFERTIELLLNSGSSTRQRTMLSVSDPINLPGALVLDTLGELRSVMQLADVVFMGGSLADRGGHNILEPAFESKAIVVGPNMQNFQAIYEDFKASRAILPISDEVELPRAVEGLLKDPEYRATLGKRAFECAQRQRGATERCLREVEHLYRNSIAEPPANWLSRMILKPLTLGWQCLSRNKARKQTASARQLPRPVVSVGNLSMGGSGKTPHVLWLGEHRRAQ